MILLIEDEADTTECIKTILEKAGIEVHSEYDVISGLVFCENNKVDVVILDLMMPNFSGFSFLRVKGRSLPIIVLTNLPSDKNKALCLEAGAKEYFVKTDISFLDLPKLVKQYENS